MLGLWIKANWKWWNRRWQECECWRLGISELRWTGMGEFNSDNNYIYYCGQESLRRNGVAIIVNRRVWNAVLQCSLKDDRMISVRFQGKPFSITAVQVYGLTSWSLVPLPFLNPAWTSGSSWFMYCWSLAWRILSITLLVYEIRAVVWYAEEAEQFYEDLQTF